MGVIVVLAAVAVCFALARVEIVKKLLADLARAGARRVLAARVRQQLPEVQGRRLYGRRSLGLGLGVPEVQFVRRLALVSLDLLLDLWAELRVLAHGRGADLDLLQHLEGLGPGVVRAVIGGGRLVPYGQDRVERGLAWVLETLQSGLAHVVRDLLDLVPIHRSAGVAEEGVVQLGREFVRRVDLDGLRLLLAQLPRRLLVEGGIGGVLLLDHHLPTVVVLEERAVLVLGPRLLNDLVRRLGRDWQAGLVVHGRRRLAHVLVQVVAVLRHDVPRRGLDEADARPRVLGDMDVPSGYLLGERGLVRLLRVLLVRQVLRRGGDPVDHALVGVQSRATALLERCLVLALRLLEADLLQRVGQTGELLNREQRRLRNGWDVHHALGGGDRADLGVVLRRWYKSDLLSSQGRSPPS